MKALLRAMRLGLFASAGIALVAFGWGFMNDGWLSSEPFFSRADREYTYSCKDPERPADTFWVRFSDGGTRASIRFRDRAASLQFRRGGFAGDVYSGEGLTLYIDPEVYVEGYLDRTIGPCDGQAW